MQVVRQLGQEGENAAGIVKNTSRIEALSGKATYRIPHGRTATRLTEVKNVGALVFTAQLRDSLHYAIMTNREFVLIVKEFTQLSPTLERAVAAGWITLRRILP